MSYGIDENTKESEVSSPIQPGVQENISLTGVDFAPITEGNDPLIQVHLADDYGGVLDEILWPVDEADVREREASRPEPRKHKRTNNILGFEKGEEVTPDDAVKMAYALFNQRAKHIAARIADEETIVSALEGAGSYAEFGEAYASLFTESRLANKKFRLAVTVNNKGYSKLPTYPPFIESMEVPAEQSKISLNDYDKNKIAQAQASNGQADDPDLVASGDSGMDDTPVF